METIDITKPIRIKKEYCDSTEEHDMIFKITNYNEVTKRCYIQLITNDSLPPQELVSINMIENV